jgi:hypothetical protein
VPLARLQRVLVAQVRDRNLLDQMPLQDRQLLKTRQLTTAYEDVSWNSPEERVMLTAR